MSFGSRSSRFAQWVIAFFVTLSTSAPFGLTAGTSSLYSQDSKEKEPQPQPQEPGEGDPKEKGRPGNAEGYDEYLTVTDLKYVAPEKGGSQVLQLKFDLIDDIPKGCVIRLSLDMNGLPLEETTYTLKDETHKGLSFAWKFSKKVALGEYQIRTHIDLEKVDLEKQTHTPAQTPAVLKLIKQNPKRFPPKSAPWSWYAKTFNLGTPEDENRERDEICEAYTGFMDQLLENLSEFKEKMDKAMKGEDLAEGGTLDTKKLEAFVKEWREKQATTQKEILTFQGKEPGMVQKSLSAYKSLLRFGQMVSQRSAQLQKEVADKYKATDPNPVVKGFDKSYKSRVEPRLLENTYETIRQILGCPKEEAEAAPEDGAEPPAGEPKDGEPKEEVKDAPGDGEKQPEETPEKPAEPDPKEKSKKPEAPKKDAPKKAKK